jgi:hypothetical protein
MPSEHISTWANRAPEMAKTIAAEVGAGPTSEIGLALSRVSRLIAPASI